MTTKAYDADAIEIFQDAQHVRKKPGMYVMDTGVAGAMQILKEAVDNSVDEFLNGHATKLEITIVDDTTFEVVDNGRGIPVEKHKKTKQPTITSIFTLLGSGGKFGSGGYGISSGTHGVGLTVINALCTSTDVWTKRDGTTWHQSFSKGKVATKLVKCKDRKLRKGTALQASLDPSIFKKVVFPDTKVVQMAKAISYLCPGLTVVVTTPSTGEETFQSKEGLQGMMLEQWGELDIGPLYFEWSDLWVCLGWKFGGNLEGERWKSYVNVSPTVDGGSHVDGAKLGVARALQQWSSGLSGRDLRDGLVGYIHYLVENPQFQGQSKVKLTGEEPKTTVRLALEEELGSYFAKHKKLAKEIIARALALQASKQEYKQARKVLNRIKKPGTLPPKLASCPRCQPEKRELFICEGDSAGGTAIKARDPKFQEVLPLRGKIPNAVRTSLSKLLENGEIQNILQAVGGGFGPDFRLDKMRVRNILLLCDSDPDGGHIVTLLTVFFLLYMKPLIRAGRLHIVQSPLFIAERGRQRWQGDTLEDVLEKAGNGSKLIIRRLKGHGSSSVEELRGYAMSSTRNLLGITTKRSQRALDLMGNDAAVRRDLLGIEV